MHRSSPALRPILLLAMAVAPCAGACSAAPGDAAASSADALVSNARTYLVPVDERARTLCRDEVDAYTCDAASTQAAIDRCVAAIGATDASDPCATGGAACVRTFTVDAACVGSRDPVYPDVASCAAPVPGTCSFYSACVERAIPCGEAGYALGFGEKYCTRSLDAEGFTAKGRSWRDSVVHCLQEALVPFADPAAHATCDDVTNAAFAVHPRCYTEATPSICFLPPSDVLVILKTIGAGELLAARTRAQIATTIGLCLGQIGRALSPFARAGRGEAHALRGAAAFDEARTTSADDELRAQQALWTSLADEYGVAR